jgi:hypothetical protein
VTNLIADARVVAQRVRWTALVGLGLVLWSASRKYGYVGVDWAQVFQGTAHTSCPVAFLNLIDFDWPIGVLFLVASVVTCAALVDRTKSSGSLAVLAAALAVLAFLGGLWIFRTLLESSGPNATCLFDREDGFNWGGLGLLFLVGTTIADLVQRAPSVESNTDSVTKDGDTIEGEFREQN